MRFVRRSPGRLLPALAACLFLASAPPALAQESEPPPPVTPPETGETPDPEEPETGGLRYGPEGLEFETSDGSFRIVGTLRFQWRLSYPWDNEPVQDPDFDRPTRQRLDLRRARARVRGHIGQPWMKFMVQYDLREEFLRDYVLEARKIDWLQPKLGQYKINFNRERVASSGAQQFVERSIVNRVFTVDRQIGIALDGRAGIGQGWDSSWTVGVYNGTGRAERNDDDVPMVLARYQWNPTGIVPEAPMGDVLHHEEPAALVALAGAFNRSPYTRFDSTNGGGQLLGFEPGQPGQYTVTQAVLEGVYKHRGFSAQSELHWKNVHDNVNATRTDLAGGYAQAGHFLHAVWERVPKPLELAARAAVVDRDVDISGNELAALSAGANWFFDGHRNKLSATVTYYSLGVPGGRDRDDTRLQLQWDVTF